MYDQSPINSYLTGTVLNVVISAEASIACGVSDIPIGVFGGIRSPFTRHVLHHDACIERPSEVNGRRQEHGEKEPKKRSLNNGLATALNAQRGPAIPG